MGLPDTNTFLRVLDDFVSLFFTTDYSVFHDMTLNNNYVNAFHMLALTAHNLLFPPTSWGKPNGVNTASLSFVFQTEIKSL